MVDAKSVIAIFDVGKTNKKLFLFDEQYRIVYEKSARFNETLDEDGEPCENLESLRQSVFSSMREVLKLKEFDVKAVNFSAYGASFVYLDENGKELTPLYNYLKPYPDDLKRRLYTVHGSEGTLAMQTASPPLGSLNSGLQLYRLKHTQPQIYDKVKAALHLPQYLSYLLTGKPCSDMTSIGCHTSLWDFEKNSYHDWVIAEGLTEKLAPIAACDNTITTNFEGHKLNVGIGLHDSSAALIPYLVSFNEPFVLLSTGTWSISLNPFDQTPLTAAELENDCLKYIQFKGRPVKASRLFAGYEYEQQTRRIAEHFGQNAAKYKHTEFNPDIVEQLEKKYPTRQGRAIGTIQFAARDLSEFNNDIEAYYQLMRDIITQQKASTKLVMKGTPVKRIFVDGGFGKNPVFMQLLALAFPGMEVFAGSMAQATGIGAALAIHQAWNNRPQPTDLIALKYYSGKNTHAF
ncbi:FGGY-family carbohydrate kinase [Mucilaginibacter litoreus]|uniref:FGGY-family carbohydrate kinase n=1 Tax=Mucilaginibacter litoreus TaxID=1048221 RepID=A0ABW3AVG0_9SPHI